MYNVIYVTYLAVFSPQFPIWNLLYTSVKPSPTNPSFNHEISFHEIKEKINFVRTFNLNTYHFSIIKGIGSILVKDVWTPALPLV